jgi:hypothetical protein
MTSSRKGFWTLLSPSLPFHLTRHGSDSILIHAEIAMSIKRLNADDQSAHIFRLPPPPPP